MRDEHARLTALRDEVGQKAVMMKRLAHGDNAAVTSRGEIPATGRPHQAD
jgi:hypothetical protein